MTVPLGASCSTGTGPLLGEFASATLGTLSSFENFDILTHVQGAAPGSRQVQAIGALEALAGDQSVTAAPEPASLLFIVAPGLFAAILRRRRVPVS